MTHQLNSATKINTSVLDSLIFGRVEPHIYAFSTGTVPNYLKVGDTYRPIERRLNEWRKNFPDLKKQFESLAKADNETFFRDHSVHNFLENELGKLRLERTEFKGLSYYSNEFFKDTNAQDLKNAINDIISCYKNNESKYHFYSFDESRVPINHTYKRNDNYEPRPNQQKTIDNFKKAVRKGRSNLLMYAVMRFGKSFTSMCCATEMNARFVLVVSAKADVKEEWKKTVESHTKFKDYTFLDSNSLLQSKSILTDKLLAKENIVLFLTLQDLQGDVIKSKHKEVFSNEIDLLLIDETHFGARATEYGKVLNAQNLTKTEIKNELALNDNFLDELDETTKSINAKIRIHLSGTPYRILMNSEFTNEDIIAFYQFSDITDDQKGWDENNLNKDTVKEWDNPYYGFPQMIRFAFNPNESSRKKMEEMRKNGISYTFSTLFKPKSITKDNKNKLHKEFEHEQEVIDLLRVIDGTKKDENVLSFLDYDKIKEGKMCRHLVFVLPYRASCDALEKLIKTNKFKNLSDYEIINISGVDDERKYKDTQSVQSKIKKCESNGIKTITLTVNRMLTGSTVHEWDTMLYLKDTASPQEYDQAIFRLQNQYIKTYKEPSGDLVKFNMKPQTLLVDFSPNRMFQMQEQKSQIYNVNTESNGNSKLEERLKRELEISPIVVLNNKKVVQISPTDILDVIREYSSDRSVLDEATSISIDYSLLGIDVIKAEIEKQGEIGSRQGIEIKAAEGEGDEMDVENDLGIDKNGKEKENAPITLEGEAEKDYRGKFAMYYARILFFSFLTDSKVKSLHEIIENIDNNTDNSRIANNLNLQKDILVLFQKHINPFVLSELDYKIHNINSLANDLSLEPVVRASRAFKKFSRLSDSEIATPEFVTEKIIDLIPKNAITNSTNFLDIASKQGEFVYAAYKKFGKKIANNFYSIPTSKIAYEFTRKLYKLLELDVNNIESRYTSYDLLEKNDLIVEKNLQINNNNMKFDAIVGNPPYQVTTDTNFATPVYHLFFEAAKSLNPDYVSMIHPARFLFNAGATPKEWNKQMLNDPHLSVPLYEPNSQKIFSGVDIKGGICATLWSRNTQGGGLGGSFVAYEELRTILKKVKVGGFDALVSTAGGSPTIRYEDKFGRKRSYFRTSAFFDLPDVFSLKQDIDHKVKIVGLEKGGKRSERFVSPKMIIDPNLNNWKVFLPKSNGSGAIGEVLSTPLMGEPLTGCTESFIQIGSFDNQNDANNCMKYIKTKFCRAILGILKVTQDNPKSTWKNVPLQDFTKKSDIDWTKSIAETDKQLYAKYGLNKKEIDFLETRVKVMS